MVQFAEIFPDIKIVSPLATQLSWSLFTEILPLETQEARLFYANDAAARNLGKRELRRQISRKAYEKREIANTQLSEKSAVPFNVFKDPYLLDSLGLILCTKANRNQIELFELDKAGIAVTEYWTNLQPKTLLEEKINSIISEAQERLERRKLLGDGKSGRQIDYFYEPKDDETRG